MEPNRIHLENVTKEDCKLLDEIWALGEWSDVEIYLSSKTPEIRQRCETLINMLLLEVVETELTDTEDLSVARKLLNNIGIKC